MVHLLPRAMLIESKDEMPRRPPLYLYRMAKALSVMSILLILPIQTSSVEVMGGPAVPDKDRSDENILIQTVRSGVGVEVSMSYEKKDAVEGGFIGWFSNKDEDEELDSGGNFENIKAKIDDNYEGKPDLDEFSDGGFIGWFSNKDEDEELDSGGNFENIKAKIDDNYESKPDLDVFSDVGFIGWFSNKDEDEELDSGGNFENIKAKIDDNYEGQPDLDVFSDGGFIGWFSNKDEEERLDSVGSIKSIEPKKDVKYEGKLKFNQFKSLFKNEEKSINYSAFIQDNDREIKIYENVTSSQSGIFLWEIDGVSPREKLSNPNDKVSVSKDGQYAMYKSGGRVQLLSKSTSAKCVNGFPGCQEMKWKLQKWNLGEKRITIRAKPEGFVALVSVKKIDWKYKETLCLKWSWGMCTSSFKVHMPILVNQFKFLHILGTKILKPQEQQEFKGDKCKEGYLLGTKGCNPKYCTMNNFICWKLRPGYRTGGDGYKIINLGHSNIFCQDGYYAAGMNSDATKLYCRKVEKVTYPSLVNNHWEHWEDYYALPSNEQLSQKDKNPTKCPPGTEVPENECHVAGIASLQQWGKTSADWNGYTVLKYHELPYGCSIITDDIHHIIYNQHKNGSSRSKYRLVCKPINTKITSKHTKSTVLPLRSEIGSDKSFGNGSKSFSRDGSVIVIAAPIENKVVIYTRKGNKISKRKVVDGQIADVSDDGLVVGIVKSTASDCNVLVYGRRSDNDSFVNIGGIMENESCGAQILNEGFKIKHEDDEIWYYTKEVKYKLTCTDINSTLRSNNNNAKPFVCMCHDGYINSGRKGGKILEDGFACIAHCKHFTMHHFDLDTKCIVYEYNVEDFDGCTKLCKENKDTCKYFNYAKAAKSCQMSCKLSSNSLTPSGAFPNGGEQDAGTC